MRGSLAKALSSAPSGSDADERSSSLCQGCHVGDRAVVLAGTEAGHVHARRAEPRAGEQPRVGDRLPQALGGVARAHEHGPRRGQALAGEAEEALRLGLDGVLERAAVDLHRIGDGTVQRPREDHGPHHEVVGERQLGARAVGHLGARRRRSPPGSPQLRVAQLREGAGLDALVAVGDVHRQQAADVGPVDRAARRQLPRGRSRRTRRLAGVPVAGGVHELQPLGVAILAQQVDLVSQARERQRQARVVDVGTGPGEQVAVEDEDARH